MARRRTPPELRRRTQRIENREKYRIQPILYSQFTILYLFRGGYYRVSNAGEIQRFGQRTQRLGSGSITEHGWYTCSLRGVCWLQVVADGRLVRKVSGVQDGLTGDDRQHPASHSPGEAAAANAKPVQLRLFGETEQQGLNVAPRD